MKELVVIFLCLGVPGLRAQDNVPRIEFSAQAGWQPKLADFSQSARLSSSLRYRFRPNDAIELSYSINHKWSIASVATPILPAGVVIEPGRLSIWTSEASLNYVRYVSQCRGIRPFLTGGLGFALFSGGSADPGDFRFAANLGAGADIPLSSSIALRLEGREVLINGPPALLQGVNHSFVPSAGLVIGANAWSSGPDSFARFEFFLGGGGSFFTGGSSAPTAISVPVALGQFKSAVLVYRGSFSRTWRTLAGVRVYLTRHDAIEAGFVYSPNRLGVTGTLTPPVAVVAPSDVTSVFAAIPFNYVRRLRSRGPMLPFVTAGLGIARFAGNHDINKLMWDFGGGADVQLNRWVALRFEMRDYIVGQPDSLRGVTHNLAPTMGLAFRFH